MRNTMYKYGVLVTNFLLVSVTLGDPDTFPTETECAFINCQQNSTEHECCSNNNPEHTGGTDDLHTNTAAIFFVAVIGSLIAVIFMMFFCMNCEKMCNKLYQKKTTNSGPSSSINTVSSGVQTNSNTDTPPPYTFRDVYCPCNTVENGGTVEFHIPRCPSYVKDPPNYMEVIDENETRVTLESEPNSNDTAIEISVNSDAVV